MSDGIGQSAVMANPWLITGATGFIGGQLARRLPGERALRFAVRDASRLGRGLEGEVVEGDLDDPDVLAEALAGVDAAFYLVHSMEAGEESFSERDRTLAEGFAAAAREAQVRRVVYLGGLVSDDDGSSEHLDSRAEVARILREDGPELVDLRASMVVGAGSGSFRTLAQLVERLPFVALPSWRSHRTEPIAIADVVEALVVAARRDVAPGTYDVGGGEVLTFEEIVETVVELLGVDRPTLRVPVSSSAIEGAVASVVTDADRELVTPLMEGLHGDLLTRDNALEPVFGVKPTPFRDAAREALEQLAAEDG